MKRDMDLCRRILLAVEASPPNQYVSRFAFTGDYPENTVSEHVVLLENAGLLEANLTPLMGGTFYVIKRLTWEGHEFLNAARDEGVWTKTLQTIGEGIHTISFAVLKQQLLEVASTL